MTHFTRVGHERRESAAPTRAPMAEVRSWTIHTRKGGRNGALAARRWLAKRNRIIGRPSLVEPCTVSSGMQSEGGVLQCARACKVAHRVGQEWAESAFQCQGKLCTCVQGGGYMHAPQQPWRDCPDRPPVERRTGGCLRLRLCWHIEHSTETAGCDSGGTVTKRQRGVW